MLVDLRLIPYYLAQMTDIESARLWLWYRLTQHGEAHLAHLILATGLAAVETLRVLDRPLAHLGYANGSTVASALAPWGGAVLAVGEALKKYRTPENVYKRLRYLHNQCVGMIDVASRKPLPSECSKIEPGECLAPKESPCESVPSTTAESPSQTPSSAANPTGTPSTSACADESGKHMIGTAQATTTSSHFEELNVSSSSKRGKRGTGHGRRATPYTRGSGKNLP